MPSAGGTGAAEASNSPYFNWDNYGYGYSTGKSAPQQPTAAGAAVPTEAGGMMNMMQLMGMQVGMGAGQPHTTQQVPSYYSCAFIVPSL